MTPSGTDSAVAAGPTQETGAEGVAVETPPGQDADAPLSPIYHLGLHLGSLVCAGVLVVVVLASPLLGVANRTPTFWHVVWAASAVIVGLQVYSLWRYRKAERAAEEQPVLERPERDEIDFDAPWRED